MSDTKTLRDWLAMNAPLVENDRLSTVTSSDRIETLVRTQYAYADIALRIRAETMPKGCGVPSFMSAYQHETMDCRAQEELTSVWLNENLNPEAKLLSAFRLGIEQGKRNCAKSVEAKE